MTRKVWCWWKRSSGGKTDDVEKRMAMVDVVSGIVVGVTGVDWRRRR